MSTRKMIAVSALAALGLAACNNPEDRRMGAGSRICTPFPEAANTNQTAPAVAPTPTDPAAALDDCLHRWGYTLATTTDRAEEVAQATVAACVPALSRWNQQALAPSGVAGVPGAPTTTPSMSESAPSLLTGQPTTPLAEHYAFAQNRALFYVVQARAGKCAPPPATTPANANR